MRARLFCVSLGVSLFIYPAFSFWRGRVLLFCFRPTLFILISVASGTRLITFTVSDALRRTSANFEPIEGASRREDEVSYRRVRQRRTAPSIRRFGKRTRDTNARVVRLHGRKFLRWTRSIRVQAFAPFTDRAARGGARARATVTSIGKKAR